MNINNDYLNTIIDELNMMVLVISKDNTLIAANKIMLEFAGVSFEEIQGEALWDLPWLKHDTDLQNKLLFALTDSYMGRSSRFNASHKRPNGETHEIDYIVKPVMKDDEPEYFIAMGYNITDLVQARKALTQRERRVKAFFDYSIEGYFFLSLPDRLRRGTVSDQNITEIVEHFKLEDSNDRLRDILGTSSDTPEGIFNDMNIYDDINDLLGCIIKEGSASVEKTIEVEGQIKHIQIVIVAIYDEEYFEGSFGIVRDITDQIVHIEQITYLANKDFLTGINNRRNFFNEGNQLFEDYKKANKPMTMVMFDIDHFKKVNDTYGHDAGDVVIRDLAKLVEAEICDLSVLGRYGGEEYIVLVPHSMDKVYKQFEEIRKKIDETIFNGDKTPVHVAVSIGLYAVDYEVDTVESCITKSDKALYESKENGRNQSTVFVESIHGESSQDLLTGLYTEKSVRYKLAKSLHDVKMMEETLWVIYFKLDVIKEDRLLTEPRHYKTMALCLKKSIRASDYAGRLGRSGFIVVLRNVNMKQAEDKHQRMVDNFDIGFSGMINNVITMKSCVYNASLNSHLDNVLDGLKKQQANLY